MWEKSFIQGNVGLQRSQNQGFNRAWRRLGALGKRGVGEISTQDDAAHQQRKEHPQQQQCHPDGPTWTAREEDMWVSTEPLSSAFQTTPMLVTSPLISQSPGQPTSQGQEEGISGWGWAENCPGSLLVLTYAPCSLWALVPWGRQLPEVD